MSAFVIITGIIFFIAIIKGLVVMLLWNWFVVPLGVPYINFIHSIGIALVINYLTMHDYSTKSKKENFEQMFNSVVTSFIAIVVGYIIYLLMYI